MRATEEEALVTVVMREHRRLGVPLGYGAYAILAAPGRPLAHTVPPGPTGAPRDPRRRPPPLSTSDPQPGPSGAQGGPARPPSPQPGPSRTQGGPLGCSLVLQTHVWAVTIGVV